MTWCALMVSMWSSQHAIALTPCEKPLYVIVTPGNMGGASTLADVLDQHRIKVTFLLSNERTQNGGGSLDESWRQWWKARSREGHAFGSGTWNRLIFKKQVDDGWEVRPSAGVDEGQRITMTSDQICEEIKKPAARFSEMTQRITFPWAMLGEHTSDGLSQAIAHCGWRDLDQIDAKKVNVRKILDQVGVPEKERLEEALAHFEDKEWLMWDMNSTKNKHKQVVQMFGQLIDKAQSMGYCFASLAQHPQLDDKANDNALVGALSNDRR